MADVVAKLTKPTPIGSVPSIDPGVVALFKDSSWTSSRYDIRINDYSEKSRSLFRQDFWDTATWVAWNLPIGTVVTLADFRPPSPDPAQVGDLSNLGITVDLVGTGKPESTDLRSVGLNDIAASFFWRKVDFSKGVVEMYADPNYTGVRQFLFLSEWPADTAINIENWHMNDRMSSVRWKALPDKQMVRFFADTNSGGQSLNMVNGWSSSKQIDFLGPYAFDDTVSCFSWSGLKPKYEEIQTLNFDVKAGSGQQIATAVNYENHTPKDQNIQITFNDLQSKTVTVTTTDSFAAGVKTTIKAEQTTGVPGVASATISFAMELSFTYDHTFESQVSTTNSTQVQTTWPLVAAANGKTTAFLQGSIGQVPQAPYQVTAIRWYDQKLDGSEYDSAKQLWRRTETITVIISGALIGNVLVNSSFKKF